MTAVKPDFVPRMEGLDALRGFALMGLFLVHMPELYELYWAHQATDPTQLLWHDIIFTIFAGKAFALLALCFGVSFFVIMDRSAKRGIDFTGRFIWRLVLLGLIGIVHGLWYRGDVLEVLAVMGLFLIPFYRVKSNTVVTALGIVFLCQPLLIFQMVSALQGAGWANQKPASWGGTIPEAYLTGKSLIETIRMNWVDGHPFKWLFMLEAGRLSQILGLSLIGMVLGRVGFFSQPERFAKIRVVGWAIAGVVALGLYLGKSKLVALVPTSEAMFMPRSLWDTIVSSWFDLSLMATLALGFLSLYYGAGHRVLRLLAPAGRMTLTLYVLQSIIFVPVFYSFGLGLHATMQQSTAVLIGIAAFAVQVAAAHLWFRYFLYGPLEWLWRAGTYLTVKVPFIRPRASA
ncbi:DUF418 domain-containing protein [Asticcacaulis sp. AC466]|uniref:DUF418 domain-containing protein n=1 Tax=Asticcacaulis sp. AC466 TaxID=1282362 RepID=UPI0003FC045B|nr:DUF418 domain-containing protein [Asticcacaulis sp. AC466]